MALQRRYGPTLGAGVVLIETPPDRQLQPAPLGSIGYAGILEKGAVGELLHCPNLAAFRRVCGGLIEDDDTPAAAVDFYNLGDGAGEGWFVRITDGSELAAKLLCYTKQTGRYFYTGKDADPLYDEVPRPALLIEAENGGTWAGRRRLIQGDVTNPPPSADVTATTLSTGIATIPTRSGTRALLDDEWKGGTVELEGVTDRTYEIIGNDTAGVVEVSADADMAADLAAGADPTNPTFRLRVPHRLQYEDDRVTKVCEVRFKRGEEDQAALFGLEVYVDGSKVLDYPNLSLDPTSKYHVEGVINDDPSNTEITVTDLYTGAYAEKFQPADWFGELIGLSGGTLTIDPFQVIEQTGTGDGYVSGFVDSAATEALKRMRVEITLTGAAAFDVEVTEGEGEIVIDDLAAGAVGAPYTIPGPWGFTFTVTAGGVPFVLGDTITFLVRPLPTDVNDDGLLAGRFVAPDHASNPNTLFRIKSNTDRTLDLDSAPAVGSAALPATFDFTPPGGFPCTVIAGPGGNDEFDFDIDTSGEGTILNVPSGGVNVIAAGAYADAALLAAAIEAAWVAAGGPAGAWTGDAATGVLTYTEPTAGLAGYHSRITANAVADSCYTLLGIDTALGAIPGTEWGALGTEVRIEGGSELLGGYDGIANVADADYLAAFALGGSSPWERLINRNAGLVKFATPGITSSTVVKAGLAYAEARNYQFRVEIPATVTTEAAAIDWINDTIGRNDFGVTSWPSFGYIPNPIGGNTLVLQTLTGMIQGREALVAGAYQGYHKVAAGIDVTLPNLVELPTGEAVLDEEALNPQGINVIKKMRGNFVLWGARTIALDPGWKWKQQRETMSHYEHILQEQFDYIIFAINDPITWQELLAVLRAFFLPEWTKRALRGNTFDEAASFKIDSENNTNLTMAAGDLNAEIKLRLADTVERFIIRIGKAGIFEDLSA